MFGLYPAGSRWARSFTASTDAKSLQKLLVTYGGCTAALFHQPFGAQRGAVIAQRDGLVVLAHVVDADQAEIVVTPGIDLQNLLWSFDSGYSGQWSGRELQILTGCPDWHSMLEQTSDAFRRVCGTVQSAVEGTLGKQASPPESTPPVDGFDIPFFTPDDYDQLISVSESQSCGH
ncbi:MULTISPECIES: hypothetical protein [unclassified Burkholderia]|uniref:hypothetical protein n=1 Tax=unclassified Burkholderia TaxID=2613784 RepID=UPI001422BF12|nr:MULTISPECIES: hypothetical protein [unclassified Burkholderia]NIE81848.1 hypothetical protein [Burkholderia sp. Tr-860]NIF61188.1 hypothetical protein [Burkholderia sp. Cy-647]NIF93939.1 hypothetical protein [Burkholderia sp. Ax-1720]